MKRILVAVDGSTASVHAAQTAAELAQAEGGEVTLAYVVAPAYVASEFAMGMAPWTDEAVPCRLGPSYC